MILGIGTDLVDIRRIETLLDRYQDRFETRILSEQERLLAANQTQTKAHRIAKYVAAKEAGFKALGADRQSGISWHDFIISYSPAGQPQLTLEAEAKNFLFRRLSKGLIHSIHLSLSDEYPYAQAFVVIEAFPAII